MMSHIENDGNKNVLLKKKESCAFMELKTGKKYNMMKKKLVLTVDKKNGLLLYILLCNNEVFN